MSSSELPLGPVWPLDSLDFPLKSGEISGFGGSGELRLAQYMPCRALYMSTYWPKGPKRGDLGHFGPFWAILGTFGHFELLWAPLGPLWLPPKIRAVVMSSSELPLGRSGTGFHWISLDFP